MIFNDIENGWMEFHEYGKNLTGYVEKRGPVYLAVVGHETPATAWEKVFDTQHDAAKAIIMELTNRSNDTDSPLRGGLVTLCCKKNNSKRIGPYRVIEEVDKEAEEQFLDFIAKKKGSKNYEIEEYAEWLITNGYIWPLTAEYWIQFQY